MLQEKYAKLDDLAAPNCYVAPPTSEDLSYVVHFRQICKRYNIDFSSADSDEKNFVMKMAEKSFMPKRAWYIKFIMPQATERNERVTLFD